MAVMGSSLARNMARHGYRVALFNRTHSKTQEVVADHGSEGTFVPAETVEEFVASLERPRRIVIMVKAGKGTDATIDTLLPHLEEGDIVVDGGNAYFDDTRRREARLRELGLHFVGAGISGGEVGALEGPSIMVGIARGQTSASRRQTSHWIRPASTCPLPHRPGRLLMTPPVDGRKLGQRLAWSLLASWPCLSWPWSSPQSSASHSSTRQGGNSATALASLAIGGSAAALGLILGFREAYQAS
jgi:hypothetical protein